MIKRLLIILFICIVIIAIGITYLAIFIDPNSFRSVISEKVRDKTGYQLTIKGDLRWHIWPQISILTDEVVLFDEGANKPILTADNMRLDVELLPLFSKNLTVKDVLIRSTVINLTDESQGLVAQGKEKHATTTINQIKQTEVKTDQSTSNHRWSLVLNKLRVADATIVVQHKRDFITFRNLDITINKKEDKMALIKLSGDINRNQRDLIYQLDAQVDLNQFPEAISVELAKLDYEYSGIGVPTDKLAGQISGSIHYQMSPKLIESKNIHFSINGNELWGSVITQFGDKIKTDLVLNSDKIDLTPYLPSQSKSTSHNNMKTQQTAPVIAEPKHTTNELHFLTNFDANLLLNIQQMQFNELELMNLSFDAANQNGLTTLKNISFDTIGSSGNHGHIRADGVANGAERTMLLKLNTDSKAIDVGWILNQFGIKNTLQGQFDIRGDLTTTTLVPKNILSALNANFSISADRAAFEGFNLASLIQNGFYQYAKMRLSANEKLTLTELHQLQADVNLRQGNVQISSISSQLTPFDLVGEGNIDLIKQNADVNLKSTVSENSHDVNIPSQLKQLAILIRIYGEFTKLSYQIELDKSAKELIGDKLQNKLDKLRDRLKSRK